MNEQTLREQLQQLVQAVQALPADNPQRATLETLIADIESQLGTADEDGSLVEQVDAVMSTFELEHPRIAGILNNIIATLGNIGV